MLAANNAAARCCITEDRNFRLDSRQIIDATGSKGSPPGLPVKIRAAANKSRKGIGSWN